MTDNNRKTIFSDDRKYCYTLWRVINPLFAKEYICFICLNPSTADEITDDNTVRRCIKFANREGYGAACVLNLFAFRSTDPSTIRREVDPVGPDNDAYIQRITNQAVKTVIAWGVHGTYRRRNLDVLWLLRNAKLYCFGTTKKGHPKHPLYLKSDVGIVPF